jgi:three-Cys-motif partner protein
MADTLPTIWPAEPHTLAKHGILKTYLEAWAAILARSPWTQASELLFVDGFAGPGEYAGGEPGSPIVALDAIAQHSVALSKPVRLRFIENDPERWAHLNQRLQARTVQLGSNTNVIVDSPILSDCDPAIRSLISDRTQSDQPVGPALFFLDQFGYSHVPMDLVKTIMRHEKCEIFSYMNFLRLNQFLPDQTKWAGITAAFGDERWRPALNMSGQAREDFLRRAYTSAIEENGKVDYVWPFAMFDNLGRLIHWLIFSTNNLKGLEEMKKAMWKADKNGTYRFSDRDNPAQQRFLIGFDDEWLAEELVTQFKGQTASEKKIGAFVLTKTPCYKFKTAVNKLRADGRVTPATRTYPVRFH